MTPGDHEQIRDQGATQSDRSLTPSQLVAALMREHPEWVAEVVEALNETTAIVKRENLVSICTYLKSSPESHFDFLADICGVDRGPEEEPRFEVNYHLFSTTKYHRLRIKVLLTDEDPHVPTVTSVWRTANWHERETFDLFGVIFDEHPDLRRILLPDDWQG